MARQIFIVNANQVVVSENHPEGMHSVIQNFPKYFDSRNYGASETDPNGSEDLALIVAQAEYSAEVAQLATANNPSRVAWNVSINRASDGKQIYLKSWGAFPFITPTPEPEPEEPENPEEPDSGEEPPAE